MNEYDIGKGFVRYIDHMGNDSAVAQAARASYQGGTKTVNEDRGLLSYLHRHKHFSPFGMCELKLQVRAPMFVFNQWVRHDRFIFNVESARYSVLSEDFWVPEDTGGFRAQGSGANKQVGSGVLEKDKYEEAEYLHATSEMDCRSSYNRLLELGVCREQARSVTSVGQYITFFVKANLGDWLLFLKARLDEHAQLEIRLYAQAVFEIIKEHWPIIAQDFLDYQLNAITFTAKEIAAMNKLGVFIDVLDFLPEEKEKRDLIFGLSMSTTERAEFIQKIKRIVQRDNSVGVLNDTSE